MVSAKIQFISFFCKQNVVEMVILLTAFVLKMFNLGGI